MDLLRSSRRCQTNSVALLVSHQPIHPLASFAHGGANDGVPLHEDVGHVSGLPARTAILYLTGGGLLTVGSEHVPAAPGRLVTFDGGSHAFAHDASEAHSDGFRYMIGPFSLDPLTFDSVGGSLTFEAIGNAGGVVTTNPPPSPPPPSPSLTAATVAMVGAAATVPRLVLSRPQPPLALEVPAGLG